MNPLKKAFYISIGCLLMVFGAFALFMAIILTDLEVNQKIIVATGSIAVILLGWWLLRRGSRSVCEALAWLFVHLIP
jgi:positive regulator of sigma E activity